MNRLWREIGRVRSARRHESLGEHWCAQERKVAGAMVLQVKVLAHMPQAGVRLFDSKVDAVGPSSARSVQPAVSHTAVRALFSLRHLIQTLSGAKKQADLFTKAFKGKGRTKGWSNHQNQFNGAADQNINRD